MGKHLRNGTFFVAALALGGGCTSLLGEFQLAAGPSEGDGGGTKEAGRSDAPLAGDGASDVVTDAPTGDTAPDVTPGDTILEAKAITTGNAHTCAVVAYHMTTGQDVTTTYCWGNNGRGQLGAPASAPPFARPDVAQGTALASVSASSQGNFTCGLDTLGGAWCWGANDRGQVGAGITNDPAPPLRVQDTSAAPPTFSVISAGSSHACGVTGSGTVHCWGDNQSCQLALYDIQNQQCAPSQSLIALASSRLQTAANARALSAGDDHTCAVTQQSDVVCWGKNRSGEVVSPPTGYVTDATAIRYAGQGLSGQWVAAGQGYSCSTGGAATCWGENGLGQSADGVASSFPMSPTAVFQNHKVAGIAAGTNVTCGIVTSPAPPKVFCMGGNVSGELGNGTISNGPNAPQTVSGIEDATSVAVGGSHVCAIARAVGAGPSLPRSVWCWGNNSSGQVDPMVDRARPSTVPVRVSLPKLPPP